MDFNLALNLILLLLGLLVFYRIVGGDNPLEFWHLFGTKSSDDKIYVDNDKVGQLVGLVFGTWVICYITVHYLTKKEAGLDGYFVACLAIWLIYCAGMSAFGKWARAFVHDRFGARGQERVESAKRESKSP